MYPWRNTDMNAVVARKVMLLANPGLASEQVYTGRKTGGIENQGDAHVTAKTSD